MQEFEGGAQWPERVNLRQQTFSERCGFDECSVSVEKIRYQDRNSLGDGYGGQVLPAQ